MTPPPRPAEPHYSPGAVWLALCFCVGVIAVCVWATLDEAPRREAYRNRAAASDAYWRARERVAAAGEAARERNLPAPPTP